MAYLHCHTCDWSQDDFWDKDGYNPFRKDIVEDMLDNLFKDRIYMDKFIFEDLGAKFNEVHKDEKGWWIKGQDLVALNLERKARSIRKMFVRTEADWKQVRDTVKCPNCGKRDWDID